jgi:hypothetical protein
MGFIILKQPKRINHRLPDTASLRKARLEHQEWLKERGLDKIKFRKKKSETLVIEPIEDRQGVPCGDKVPVMEKGVGSKREEMRYTGKRKLIGIATMHKSNQVPVFADDDDVSGRKAATEITLMKGNK